jgi:hypothetical protein
MIELLVSQLIIPHHQGLGLIQNDHNRKKIGRPKGAVPRVKYIKSPSEIPAGVKYLLVKYGDEYAE